MAESKTFEEIQAIVMAVHIDGHHFRTGRYTNAMHEAQEAFYVQDTYSRLDSITGVEGTGFGRKWHISPWATDSEIVLTCLKAAITNSEHEIREGFTYKGKRIFQPHIDVNVLWEACESSDSRHQPEQATQDELADLLG
jgi:hypothetical protein